MPSAPDLASDDPLGWCGETINGRYRVDRVVGKGGFGVVYRAWDLNVKAWVAVKCLSRVISETDQPRFSAGLQTEAQLLRRCSSATGAIVQAFDLGTANTPNGKWSPYLVLEWLEGSTLKQHLDDRTARGLGGRSLSEAIGFLNPAVRAIGVAHRLRVVHRDIKPSNLFIANLGEGDSTVNKVLDFGIAKVMSDVAPAAFDGATANAAGSGLSHDYGAPEQFDANLGKTGPWTDVHALALVFLEVVSGRRAYAGRTREELHCEATNRAVRPSFARLGLSFPDVEGVMDRALALEPLIRFRDAEEFWNALTDAVESKPAPRFSTHGTEPASLPAPGPTIMALAPAAPGGHAARPVAGDTHAPRSGDHPRVGQGAAPSEPSAAISPNIAAPGREGNSASAVERFLNGITDRDWLWWPFLYLRPPRHEMVSWVRVTKISLHMSASYALVLLTLLAIVFFFGNSALDRSQRLLDASASEIGVNVFFGLVLLQAATIVFVRLTFAVAWNHRAARFAARPFVAGRAAAVTANPATLRHAPAPLTGSTTSPVIDEAQPPPGRAELAVPAPPHRVSKWPYAAVGVSIVSVMGVALWNSLATSAPRGLEGGRSPGVRSSGPPPAAALFAAQPPSAARFTECAAVPLTFGTWKPTERELIDAISQMRGGACFSWTDPEVACRPVFNANGLAEAVSRCSRFAGSTSLQMRVLLETQGESCHKDCSIRVRAAESNGRRWLSVMSVPGHVADYQTDAFELRGGVPLVYFAGANYYGPPCGEGDQAVTGDTTPEDFKGLPIALRKFICNFE